MLPSLPLPSGPYVLGVSDIETDHVFLRLFYPARLSPSPAYSEEKPSWLISLAYARGYGDFLKVPAVISVPLFGAFFSGVKIPNALQDPPLFKKGQEALKKGEKEKKAPSEEKAEEKTEEQKFPLVIVSHGLGGMRTTYTAICSDLASHGFLVACVEHRDQSASMTLRNNAQAKVDYKPLPEGVDEFEFRNGQVKHRVDEMLQAYDLLKSLNEGTTLLTNQILASKFPLGSLKDRIDFSQVTALGHSFGGATAVQAAYYHSNLFHSAISLDGWMFPVNKEVFLPDHPFPGEPRPVFFLNSELFQWEKNLRDMRALVKKTNEAAGRDSKIPSSMMKILGSAHQNQSDFSVLAPTFALRRVKMLGPIDPHYCLQINNRACLVFLQRSLGWKSEAFEKDRILSRESSDRPPELIYDDSETIVDESEN